MFLKNTLKVVEIARDINENLFSSGVQRTHVQDLSIMDSTLNWDPLESTSKNWMPKSLASSEVRPIRSRWSTSLRFPCALMR